LEDVTLTKLKRAIEVLTVLLGKTHRQHDPVQTITRDDVKAALREASYANAWSNRTFNNNLSALATVFIFLESEKIIKDISTKGITKKKSKSKKHRYYDPQQFEKVRKVLW
jgi:site-specific recombinase XerD